MKKTIVINAKGRLTIPKEMRDQLGGSLTNQAAISLENGRLIITFVKKDIATFFNRSKFGNEPKNININKIRDIINYSNL